MSRLKTASKWNHKTVTHNVDAEMHKQAKIHCIEKNLNLSDFYSEAIQEKLKSDRSK